MRKKKTAKRKKATRKRVAEWFAELDRLNTEPFIKGGRRQPRTPRRKTFSS